MIAPSFSARISRPTSFALSINGDGYGCLIGLDSNGELRKQSDWGNFMRYPIDHIASDKEIDRLMRKIMDAEHITNY